jgi:hypothetical protein
MADAREFEHETAPPKTTYQGSPGPGVEHGHEGTDANIPAIIRWLGITALFMIASIALLTWVYALWSGYETRNELLPSPLFGIRQVPPEPRIMPNPVDTETHPGEPMRGPSALLVDHRRVEDAELQQYGLENPSTGAPQLPAGAVETVLTANHAGTARNGITGTGSSGTGLASPPSTTGTTEPMPSYASGGTRTENGLQ